MSIGLKTPEGDAPERVGQNPIETSKLPLFDRGVIFFSSKASELQIFSRNVVEQTGSLYRNFLPNLYALRREINLSNLSLPGLPASRTARIAELSAIGAVVLITTVAAMPVADGNNAKAEGTKAGPSPIPDAALVHQPPKENSVKTEINATAYTAIDIRSIDGQGVISVDSFNGYYLRVGKMDSVQGRLVLTDTKTLSDAPLAVAASIDNQVQVIAGVGGNFSYTPDGANWIDKRIGTMDLIDVQITPDKKYAFISKNPKIVAPATMIRLEIATGKITEFTVTGSNTATGIFKTTPLQLIAPDTYMNRGLTSDLGYSKVIYSPSGISSQPYDTHEVLFDNKLKGFGPSTLYAFNLSTELGGVAIHFENDVVVERIYPTLSLYTIKGASVDPYTLTIDNVTGLRFLAVMEQTYDMQNGNPIDKPNIELVGQNKLMSTTGLPTQGRIIDMFVIQQDGKRYLVAQFDRVITPGDGTGVFTADITNGIDPQLVWLPVSIQYNPVNKVFLPVIRK